MENKIGIIKSVLNVALIIVLGVSTLVLVLATLDTPLDLKIFNVTSGSMQPHIKIGSLVIVRSVQEYSVGDVITFYPRLTSNETVTHRISAIQEREDTGAIAYKTKGDANESEDMGTIGRESILGKVTFRVPYVGYLLAFTQTQVGFVLLIVLPASLIIYSELGAIKNELFGFVKDTKEKRSLNKGDQTS